MEVLGGLGCFHGLRGTDRLGYGFYPKYFWCENDKRTKNNLSEIACSRKEKTRGLEKQ